MSNGEFRLYRRIVIFNKFVRKFDKVNPANFLVKIEIELCSVISASMNQLIDEVGVRTDLDEF